MPSSDKTASEAGLVRGYTEITAYSDRQNRCFPAAAALSVQTRRRYLDYIPQSAIHIDLRVCLAALVGTEPILQGAGRQTSESRL